MHLATYIFGAAVALPVVCLAFPSRLVPHTLIQRTEGKSSNGPFLINRVIGGIINEIQGAAVGTETAPPDPEGSLGGQSIFIKRDSDTNEVPDGGAPILI